MCQKREIKPSSYSSASGSTGRQSLDGPDTLEALTIEPDHPMGACTRRIPFSKEFYIAERGEDAYADLLRQWRSEGWDESQGFPDVVLMKWRGTGAERSGAARRVFEEDFAGFGSGETSGRFTTARSLPQSSVRQANEAQAVGPDNGRGDTRPIRNDRGSRQPAGIRGVSAEVMGLSTVWLQTLPEDKV